MLIAVTNRFLEHVNNIKQVSNFKYNIYSVTDINCLLETVFNTEFVGMCMMYLYTQFHKPDCSGSLVIAMKPEAKYRLHAAAILLSYI
jgi:hypothetical protein